jgi:hypothetical protein
VNTVVGAVGTQHLPPVKCNVRNARAIALYQTGQAVASGLGESAPVNFLVEGTICEGRNA